MDENKKLDPQETVELDNNAKNGGGSPLSGQIDEATAPAELNDDQLEAAAGGGDVVICPECGSTNAAIGAHGIICRDPNCRYGDTTKPDPIHVQFYTTCHKCGSGEIVREIGRIRCLKCGEVRRD